MWLRSGYPELVVLFIQYLPSQETMWLLYFLIIFSNNIFFCILTTPLDTLNESASKMMHKPHIDGGLNDFNFRVVVECAGGVGDGRYNCAASIFNLSRWNYLRVARAKRASSVHKNARGTFNYNYSAVQFSRVQYFNDLIKKIDNQSASWSCFLRWVWITFELYCFGRGWNPKMSWIDNA